MVMGKTGMVRVLCLLRFHPKGNLCGVKNKVQINRPFHSYVQVLVKTSKIIYFNTVEKNAYKMVKHTNRVGKYAKFGVFCAKIVQMTPLWLRRESLRLQKFSVTNTVLSLPFSQQIQFTLIVNVVNLN